jgi:hypothetical protein
MPNPSSPSGGFGYQNVERVVQNSVSTIGSAWPNCDPVGHVDPYFCPEACLFLRILVTFYQIAVEMAHTYVFEMSPVFHTEGRPMPPWRVTTAYRLWKRFCVPLITTTYRLWETFHMPNHCRHQACLGVKSISALSQQDLNEGFNAKINKRQVSDDISFEQPGPKL